MRVVTDVDSSDCAWSPVRCGIQELRDVAEKTVRVEDRLCRGPFMSRTVCVYVFRSSISNESLSTIEVLREFHHLRILRNSGDTIPGWYVTGLLGTTLHTCCLQLAEATCAKEQIVPMPPRFFRAHDLRGVEFSRLHCLRTV